MTKVLGATMGIAGFVCVGYFFSWVLAVGVFLMLWGNNLAG
jgi:hypothetical protein